MTLQHITREPAVRIELTTARYIKEGASSEQAPTRGETYPSAEPHESREAAPNRAEVPNDRPSAASGNNEARNAAFSVPTTTPQPPHGILNQWVLLKQGGRK